MMSKRRKLTYIGAGVASLALVGGIGAAAGAAAANPMMDDDWQHQGSTVTSSNWDRDRDVAITGTIRLPAGIDDLNDQAETQALLDLATISPAQAQQAATQGQAGTASAAFVDEEDGFVVYEVYVTDGQGMVTEVTVDAGNGQVLAREADGRGPVPNQAPVAPNQEAPAVPNQEAPAAPTAP